MPIKLPEGLPALEKLAGEDVFAIAHTRAIAQDIRPLKIAILNLMPKKEETELHLLRLLSNTPLQIEVTLLYTKSYVAKNTSMEYLESFYKTFDDVKDEYYDGLIVTGAPVEVMEFDEVSYWDEFKDVLNWANRNVFSTMYICWAAQAALYHCYGIDKFLTEKKLFGIFKHKCLNQPHKLTRGFDDMFYAPHSRKSDVSLSDVEKVPSLKVLCASEDDVVFLAANESGSQVFLMGHPEYSRNTLRDEYFRDKENGDDIDLPKNYFEDDDMKKEPVIRWRAHGNLLFSNWLNYFVYQQTPFNLDEIGKQ